MTIENWYDKRSGTNGELNIIFNNVVTVATTKLKLLADVERLPVLNKELSDVYLYDKATLLSLGICLTEDGLRWDDSL